MPTRIDIIHRIIRTVRIQMQGIRVILTTPVRILGQEPFVRRIIIPGIQVIKPGARIINPSGIADFVIQIPVNSRLTKITVFIRVCTVSAAVQNTSRAGTDILVVEVIILTSFSIPLSSNDISGIT